MDPYKILGIDKDATPDEIRRAYRKKAAQYHPDKGGDVWIFQQIQDAFDELTGKKKKKRKKSESAQAAGEQPEAASGQAHNDDPFEFAPDPEPEPAPKYDRSHWQQSPPKRKAKKKSNSPLVFAACGTVFGIVAIAFLIWLVNQSGTDSGQTLASETGSKGSMNPVVQEPSGLNGLASRQSPDNTKRELEPASVSLTVSPSDAEIVVSGTGVTVEGTGRNRTIRFSSPDPNYTYKLVAAKQGYRSYSDEIRIKSGDQKEVSITLQKQASGLESRNSEIIADNRKDKNRSQANLHSNAVPTELLSVTEIQNPMAPCLSGDGLTIYYNKLRPVNQSEIFTARRSDIESLFDNEEMLFEGMHPTVTYDALEMIFVGKSATTNGHERCFYSTSRDSVDQPFRRPRPIHELNDSSNTGSWSRNPCLSSDGLTIYFNEYPREGMTRFAFSTRRDRKSQWSKPQPLELTDVGRLRFLTCPFVSEDGLTLFCVTEHENMWKDGENLLQFTRSNRQEAFGNPQPVHIEGLPTFIGRYPRYVSATNEFFFLQSDGKRFENSHIVIARPHELSTANLDIHGRSNSDLEFVSLFNGKDLSNWTGDPRFWRVVNGTIVGKRPRMARGGEYAATNETFSDFVLKLKFKLNSGDSGIQFRGDLSPDFTMSGNQANLSYENNLGELAWLYVNKEKVAWPLVRSREALAKSLDLSGWNDYVITAMGNNIKLEINGIVVVDDKRNGPKEGSIGLQLHGSGADVAFKDIFIKNLSDKLEK